MISLKVENTENTDFVVIRMVMNIHELKIICYIFPKKLACYLENFKCFQVFCFADKILQIKQQKNFIDFSDLDIFKNLSSPSPCGEHSDTSYNFTTYQKAKNLRNYSKAIFNQALMNIH